MDNRQQMVTKLNELIHLYKDSEQGFRQAAKEVNDKHTKAMFLLTANERAGYVARLQKEVRDLGGIPARGGSLPGMLHRSWMNLRYLLNLHKEQVVLQECLRGEEKALSSYVDLFFDHPFPEVEPMLSEQYVRIIEMRDHLLETLKPREKAEDHSMLHI
jgi:uncharacterized protein (TIGR02284 family)